MKDKNTVLAKINRKDVQSPNNETKKVSFSSEKHVIRTYTLTGEFPKWLTKLSNKIRHPFS